MQSSLANSEVTLREHVASSRSMKFVNLQVGWGISRSVQDHNISGQCTVKSLADKSLKVWYVDLSDCDIPRFAVQRRCVHVYIQSYTYQRIYLYMYMYVRIVNHCRYILPYHVVYIYIYDVLYKRTYTFLFWKTFRKANWAMKWVKRNQPWKIPTPKKCTNFNQPWTLPSHHQSLLQEALCTFHL